MGKVCRTSRFLGAVTLLAVLAGSSPGWAAGEKTDGSSSRLLLPLFQVDTTDINGLNTLFSVRNEGVEPIDIKVEFFETTGPQVAQMTQERILGAKELTTFNILLEPGLDADPDGFIRGFVIISSSTPGARMQGDYYRLIPNEDFASGARLLDISSTSTNNDLCNLFTMRYLNGGGFDSGTEYVVWVERDTPPEPGENTFSIAIYDQPGELQGVRSFASSSVAFTVSAADLIDGITSKDFGAIEFQFSDGAVGHISAVVSASNRYSVGLEATCGDF